MKIIYFQVDGSRYLINVHMNHATCKFIINRLLAKKHFSLLMYCDNICDTMAVTYLGQAHLVSKLG